MEYCESRKYWLVVEPTPLNNMSQLGLWLSQYMERGKMFQTTNQWTSLESISTNGWCLCLTPAGLISLRSFRVEVPLSWEPLSVNRPCHYILQPQNRIMPSQQNMPTIEKKRVSTKASRAWNQGELKLKGHVKTHLHLTFPVVISPSVFGDPMMFRRQLMQCLTCEKPAVDWLRSWQ